MRYFINAEDLVCALIGPFDTKDAAEAHIQFCIDRGDGADMEVITETEMKTIDSDVYGLILTAEEDRAWEAPRD